MYSFSYFKEKDQQRISQFIADHPLAFLTGSTPEGSQAATQVPILAEERNGELILQGHIMKRTDHYRTFEQNSNVLVVFTGPNAYVSASWYTNPSIGSTWNYMSVYANGEMKFMTDDELVTFMKKLTARFEETGEKSPTYFDNLPDDFLKKMLPAIAGFEIEVSHIDNVFKLSQNRDESSYKNIISKLEERGGSSALVANEMKKRTAELFPPGAVWDPDKFES